MPFIKLENLTSYATCKGVGLYCSKKILNKISKHKKVKMQHIKHVNCRMALLLQRGLAAMLANRVPNFPDAWIDGAH